MALGIRSCQSAGRHRRQHLQDAECDGLTATPDPAHILPDRLAPDLRVWFVGTAAGPRSAAVGAYYAHPGNRFWRALHEAGITPRLFAPHDYPLMLDLGVGLTDICKTAWGVDATLPRDQFDIAGFRAKVARLRPRALAFTSKTAASLWLGRSTAKIEIGRQGARQQPFDASAIFVLPSPSGLATSYWSIEPWQELGQWLAGPAGRNIPPRSRVTV